MNENIKKFLEKVEASPELQAKFSQIRNPDEAYKLAASIQDGFSKDEFVTEMTKLYEAQVVDLSDEDIAKIAGGGRLSDAIPEEVKDYLAGGALSFMVAAFAAEF